MSPRKKVSQIPEEKTPERKPLADMARRILLASIGAVALAQDEIEDFIQRLVERGELAEEEGKKLVREMRDKRKNEAQKIREELNKRIEEVLVRMNIPTKADIEALSEKIADLSNKVDEMMRKSQ